MKLLRFYSKENEQGVRAAVLGSLDGNKLTITVARCSETDRFSKKKARIITEGRLDKQKIYKTLSFDCWSMKQWIPLALEVANEVCATKYPYKKF